MQAPLPQDAAQDIEKADPGPLPEKAGDEPRSVNMPDQNRRREPGFVGERQAQADDLQPDRKRIDRKDVAAEQKFHRVDDKRDTPDIENPKGDHGQREAEEKLDQRRAKGGEERHESDQHAQQKIPGIDEVALHPEIENLGLEAQRGGEHKIKMPAIPGLSRDQFQPVARAKGGINPQERLSAGLRLVIWKAHRKLILPLAWTTSPVDGHF